MHGRLATPIEVGVLVEQMLVLTLKAIQGRLVRSAGGTVHTQKKSTASSVVPEVKYLKVDLSINLLLEALYPKGSWRWPEDSCTVAMYLLTSRMTVLIMGAAAVE